MKRYLSFFIALVCIMQGMNLSAAEQETPPHSQEKHEESDASQNMVPPPSMEGPVFPINTEETTKQNDRFLVELINMLATLGLIIALILLVAWFLKRMVNTRLEQVNVTSLVKIVERRSLSAKTALYLLEFENKNILLAESANGVTLLGNFPVLIEDGEKNPEGNEPSAFTKILQGKREEDKR